MPSSHGAVFEYDEADVVWLVSFPSLDGCHTYGESLEKALANAREALQVWLDEDDVTVEEDVRPSPTTAR